MGASSRTDPRTGALCRVLDRAAGPVRLLHATAIRSGRGLVTQPIDFEIATIQEGKRFSARHVARLPDFRPHRMRRDRDLRQGHRLPRARGAGPRRLPGIDRDPEGCARLDDAGGAPALRRSNGCLPICFARTRRSTWARLWSRTWAPGRSLREPRMRSWIRLRQNLGDDSALHGVASAYLSDYWIKFRGLHRPCARDVRQGCLALCGEPQPCDLVP